MIKGPLSQPHTRVALISAQSPEIGITLDMTKMGTTSRGHSAHNNKSSCCIRLESVKGLNSTVIVMVDDNVINQLSWKQEK